MRLTELIDWLSEVEDDADGEFKADIIVNPLEGGNW